MSTTLSKAIKGTIIVWFWFKKRVNYIGWACLRKTSSASLKHRLLLISTAARPTSPSWFFSSSLLHLSASLDGPEAAPLISGAAVIVMWDQKRCRSVNEHMVNKHGRTWNASGSMPLMLLLLLLPLRRVTFCLISISLLVISSSLV